MLQVVLNLSLVEKSVLTANEALAAAVEAQRARLAKTKEIKANACSVLFALEDLSEANSRVAASRSRLNSAVSGCLSAMCGEDKPEVLLEGNVADVASPAATSQYIN